MKKVLSLVLVIAMVLSSMSFAFAAKFEDVADTDYAEAIDTLFALGVITGYEDGTYRPENTVTRAEMAKLMVELLGYGDLVAGSKSNFVDTQGHWADQWIALAAGRGIVIGTGDGKFNPDGIVTYDQVLTMLVRGLGYTDNSNELKSMTWPTNFKVKAAELNITKNVDMRSANADRGGVAQAMFNSLDQQLVKVNSDGDIVKEYRVDGKDDQIPVRLISRIATPNYTFKVNFEHINPDDKNYAGDKVDLTPYLFQTVEAYFNKNKSKEVVYVGDVESLTYSDTFEDIFGSSNNTLEVGDYEFNIADASVSYNNGEVSLSDFKVADLENAKITVVLHGDETRVKDGAAVVGILVEKANAYVQIEEEYKSDATKIDEIYLPVKSNKVDSANLIVKGDATELEDIEKDDIVAAYAPLDKDPTIEATKKLTLVVSKDTVEGKVTGTSGDAYLIDRVKYEVNDAFGLVLDVDDEGIFYLDDNGKLIAFEGEDGGDRTYAVVYDSIIPGEYRVTSRGVSVTKAPSIRLSTSSNERITYEFDVELEATTVAGAPGTPAVKGTTFNTKFAATNASGGAGSGAVGATGEIRAIGEFADANLFVSGNNGKLISYGLNKDGEINKFAVNGVARPINVRTNSASFVLASNVVIFNQEGKVITEDDLGSTVDGYAVYQNGRIVALLTDIIDQGTEYYAYVATINKDTDDNGNKIQRLNAYINGSKNERLFTNEESLFPTSGGNQNVYVFTVNDNGVVIGNPAPVLATSNVAANIVTSSGISATVDSKDGKITIGTGASAVEYFLDQGATIIDRSESSSNPAVRNLNAVDRSDDTEFTIYYEVEGTGPNAINLVKFIEITVR